MSGERWERIQLLFDELIELDTGRRRARLDVLSRTDPGLSGELRSLIGAHEPAQTPHETHRSGLTSA